MTSCSWIRRAGALSALVALTSVPLGAQNPRAELREIQPRIDGAIDKGVRWLLDRQLPDGSWRFHADEYPNGQTALSVYTLLKAGISPRHPAVARGLAFLDRRLPTKTYSAGLQLMAYEAAHDAARKERMKEILKLLISWQNSDGGFGYGGEAKTRSDLSNAQYGALGFRSAMLAGIRVPTKPLDELWKYAAALQESQRQVQLPPDPVESMDGYARESRTRPGYAAGFRYVPGAEPTGSMTAAGLGVTLIVRDTYGDRLDKARAQEVATQVDLGVNWLRMNWSVEQNLSRDGSNRGWELYYLYGLERVGSLLMQEILAGHAWYLEGAQSLLRRQRGAGDFGDEADTCFAILFLKRATWAGRTTGAGAKGQEDAFAAATREVHIRGSGNPNLSIWIEDFSAPIKAKYGAERKPSEMIVLAVEYLVDGTVVARVEGDAARPWQAETFAAQHEFARNGTYQVSARVHLLEAGKKAHTADTAIDLVESAPFTVKVSTARDEAGDAMARALAGNLLASTPVQMEASSARNGSSTRAADGHQGTVWWAEDTDKEPSLLLVLGKAPTARHLWIATAPLGDSSGVEKLLVRLNGRRDSIEIVPNGEPIAKIDLERDMKVGRVQVQILRKSGPPRSVGIAEIYLFR